MNISILGTGSIGLGYAAFLSSRGHDVSLWSPSGKGAHDLLENGGILRADGKVSGEFRVSACLELRDAIAEASVVIFALPGNAHENVMRGAAAYVRGDQILVVTPIVSLSAYVLAKLVAASGAKPLICASSTTMLTARKSGGTSVSVLTLRPEVGISSFPACELDRAVAKMEMIFGPVFSPQPSILASSLSNTGPVAHVPLALMNMSRIERGESWLQYEHFTENVSRVMVAVDGERVRLGGAFGFSLCGIEEHFCRSFDTQPGTLANLAAQIVTLRNGGPSGPTTPQTRYLTEDVPFGLAFLSYLGKLTDVPTPAIDACIALANIALGQDLVLQNGLLDDIKKDISCSEDLLGLIARTSSDREGVTSTANSN
ncbi:NAD/NADP octopine/nopaline dehydrogenase family protein [Paraburkholderia sediminicola]|uniref:NAD/NADP octopine/nopaline dehydrogenase family protein n=1 Tax=Paraburkholderia sediminicola TaxID=458836 RepID=UPI0038B9B1DD